MTEASAIRKRLGDSLAAAIRAKQTVTVSALRSALGAIANAEAVEDPTAYQVRIGAGAGEVARRELSHQDITAILRAEIEERTAAASDYERLGQAERATRLRAEAAALLDYVDPDQAGR